MALSDQLVSDFVKATNPDPTPVRQTEFTAYGVVKSKNNDGTCTVLIDGGEMNTPCNTAINVSVNDRVIVTVKDRQGTVTSNITNKSINTDFLESEGAVFKWKQPTWPAYVTTVSIGESPYCPIRVYHNTNPREVQITYDQILLSGPTYGNDTYYSVDISSEGMTVFDHLADDDCWYGPRGQSPSSDRRLKEQITPLDWQIGAKLIPVSFVFSKSQSVKHFGFIAQDVREVHPDAVIEESNGRLRLVYHELIAPTLALAQHNYEEIEALKQEIAELRKEVKDLVEAQNNSVPTEK